MKACSSVTIKAALVIFALAGNFRTPAAGASALAKGPASPSKNTMRAFRSEQELASYLQELAKKQKLVPHPMASATDGFAFAPPASAAPGATAYESSITNVQHAGIDEGGIVKLYGDYLVVLRRGRLFTVSLRDGALKPTSSIDAFSPDVNPASTWYDEMLIYENMIAVIGYSYQRGGTEVGLFQIDPAGKLSYRSTYELRSNDYYSSRNYASRLIGSKLIFYSPLYLNPWGGDPMQGLPAIRKWHKGATNSEFRRISTATDVYLPNRPFGVLDLAMHTVTVCDLARGDFDCKATSAIGPAGRVFYVSPDSVYVWLSDRSDWGSRAHAKSMVYRLPLNGSSPSALGVFGSPVDQFSFLESSDGHLNVLVRSDGAGEGMWKAESREGDVALMRVPLASFSDGSQSVPSSSYRKLPRPRGYTFQNRFVGDYLLYGTGSGWGDPQKIGHSTLYAVRWDGGESYRLPLEHGTDRIEPMGQDTVVVGSDGKDLHFTAVRLGNSPEVVDDYVYPGASQGELRSHGFFYRADTQDSGMLGLPISKPGRPGYRHLFDESQAILFLRNAALHFDEIGELDARPEKTRDDGCRASCIDWYGNSRPLFIRGRVIALLGYELVEGSFEDGRIHVKSRVSYEPKNLAASKADWLSEVLTKN